MFPEEQTASLVFLDIIIYLFLFLLFHKSLKFPYEVSKSKHSIGVILIIVFVLFSFWGSDWFHYYESFPSIKSGENKHVEDVYLFIGSISPNYILFRLLIWGSGIVLFAKTISKLNVSKDLCWFIFVSSYLIWFSYARASLAMAIAFYGFALIIGKNRNIVKVLLGFGFVGVSFFFHKSTAFAIGCVLMTLLAQRFPKLTYSLLVLLFPLIVIYVNSSLAQFMTMSFDAESSNIDTYMINGQRYFEARRSVESGLGEILGRLLEQVPYYCTTALSLFAIFKSKIKPPSSIRPFMVLQVVIVLMSSVFLFTPTELTTGTIYVRFLRFAFIPTTLVLAYLYQSGYAHKLVKYNIYIAIMGAAYALTYSLYCNL